MKKFIGPLMIALFGIFWLLAQMKFFDIGQMLWTIGLLGGGILIFTYLGFSKSTFVLGSMLIIGAGFSLLRYNSIIQVEFEIPILIIILGVIMGINNTKLIPEPIDKS